MTGIHKKVAKKQQHDITCNEDFLVDNAHLWMHFWWPEYHHIRGHHERDLVAPLYGDPALILSVITQALPSSS